MVENCSIKMPLELRFLCTEVSCSYAKTTAAFLRNYSLSATIHPRSRYVIVKCDIPKIRYSGRTPKSCNTNFVVNFLQCSPGFFSSVVSFVLFYRTRIIPSYDTIWRVTALRFLPALKILFDTQWPHCGRLE